MNLRRLSALVPVPPGDRSSQPGWLMSTWRASGTSPSGPSSVGGGEEGVEVPAEAEVVGDDAEAGHVDVRIAAHQEGGYVRERHRLGAAVADGDLGDDEARRGVQAERGDGLGHLHQIGRASCRERV